MQSLKVLRLSGKGIGLKVIRKKVCVLNSTGNKKPLLRLFLAIFILLSLFGGLFLHFSGRAALDAGLGTRTVLSANHSPPRRSTAAQLRQSALKRASATPATNNVNPFVSTLGPGATSYPGSMAALRELPAVLSSNQVATLRALVSEPYSPSMALSPLEFNGVKNAATDILLQQPSFPADILADLALQHADPAQDEVWRDYCLQMLTSGYLNLAGRAGVSDHADDAPAARELALDTLMSAASAGGNTWPGTALLGLNTILASEPSAFPREELDKRILSALSDASASEAALITAIRLAGMSRLEAARPALEALASSSASELVRNVAAKSLSELGPVLPRGIVATHTTVP